MPQRSPIDMGAKLQRAVLVVVFTVAVSTVLASQIAAESHLPIDAYISKTWGTLTRSISDCAAYYDPKVKETPVLFIPAEMRISSKLRSIEQNCKIRVEHLPRRIRNLGYLRVSSLKQHGLLYLPRPYVVPGGRFNEMYGWDSYFIELGLLADHRVDLVRDIIDNFLFEVDHYGGVLNANRTYYLSRSQPPFLAAMILDYYETGRARPHLTGSDKQWLTHAYLSARKAYALWVSRKHRCQGMELSHYADYEEGPVPEMADDPGYYIKVIEWFRAHPDRAGSFVVELPERASRQEISSITCDPSVSKVCAAAHVDSSWLSKAFYEGDRADRESGFDVTFRFGPFAGNTEQYAPVCLNSLLVRYALDMSQMAKILGRDAESTRWKVSASTRIDAINKYLWNESRGLYFDYDFVERKQSTYEYLTTFYPLWAGAASTAQAAAVARNLSLFETANGLTMSRTKSGLQWDYPFGWAPCTWIAIDGLERTGERAQALRLARAFSATVERNYDAEDTIREKYDVVTGTTDISVQNGYTSNVAGFGWTNGVYSALRKLLSANQPH